MVTVVKDPTGHKISSDAIAATITEDYAGDAIVTLVYHGLGTGDYVYIDSDVDEYNGFWYVTAIDTNTFKLSEYASADYVEFFQEADIDYYETASHDWSSIFLPIVYKLTNNKWPVNTVDSSTTISVSASDNGYLEIYTTGAIKTGLQALQYIKISNCPDEDLNGVWQIIEVISDSHIVIDAAYTTTYIVNSTVQFYYNNYQVKVKVYAGLTADHPWAFKKPFEEMAELSLTPDDSNEVMFSVSDYIRGKVEIKNNLTLYSLPLNLDAFTGFYISVAESHDTADGYTVTTEESEFEDNEFTGYAIAGQLPFKNIYSGFYSEYVYVQGYPAAWLTEMSRLLAVEDKYFDISFIKNTVGDFIVQIDKYVSDYLTTTETIAYADQGIGVYRIPITADASYDSFCVTVRTDTTEQSVSLPSLASWANSTGLGTDWTTGVTPSINLAGAGFPGVNSEYLWADFLDFIPGYSYTITVAYTKTYNSGSDNPRSMVVYALDSSFNIIDSNSNVTPGSPGGSSTATLTFTATEDTTRIGIRASDGSDVDIEINSITATVIAANVDITEEICIDLLESCEAVGGFIPTDIRLLEDGSYRLLE